MLFDNLTQLELLNLRDNKLAVVKRSQMDGLNNRGKALELDMTKNPFHCDCDLNWFRNWLDDTNVNVASTSSYICVSPDDMCKSSVLDYRASDLQLHCLPRIYLFYMYVIVMLATLWLWCTYYWPLRMFKYHIFYFCRNAWRKKENTEQISTYRYVATVAYVVENADDWGWVQVQYFLIKYNQMFSATPLNC